MRDNVALMSDLSESEIYLKLLDSIRKAEGCSTQMAFHRGDVRWTKIATKFHEMLTLVTKLATGKPPH